VKTATSIDNDFDDFDDDFDASYSDIDEAPTPPSLRKLPQKRSPESVGVYGKNGKYLD
jgi:hypothetical protein